MTSDITAEKDFLFVMNIQNDVYYHNQAELSQFLKLLPPTVRLYAIIHAGMNTLKIYCITNNYYDYVSISELPEIKAEIINSKRSDRLN
jgi:hypothetical protein